MVVAVWLGSCPLDAALEDVLHHGDSCGDGGDMMHADDVATRALDELALTAVACHVLEESAEGLRGVVRAGGIGDEVETHRATLEYDLLDAEVMAETAQARDEDKLLGLWGKGTEAVAQSGGKVLELLVFAEAVQLTIEEDALAI